MKIYLKNTLILKILPFQATIYIKGRKMFKLLFKFLQIKKLHKLLLLHLWSARLAINF